jgi:multimeric flavodoxin WrbA
MKVIAINSSPKMDKGNTATILTPFLEGMREAGTEVELFYTKEMKIGPCQGDLACWLKTPGKCPQKDDMEMLLPKLAAAEVWVLATPVYLDGMNGPLKNLIDRVIPLMLPFYELRNGHCRHPLRDGTIPGKIVLVSSCGFWEIDNFDPLLSHIKAISKNTNREFAGALLRPHIRALLSMAADKGEPVGDILEAAKEAGLQLIRDGAMSNSTLDVISRRLLPSDIFIQAVNKRFEELLAGQENT